MKNEYTLSLNSLALSRRLANLMLTGKVLDKNSVNPIANVEAILTLTGAVNQMYKAKTDITGAFTFSHVAKEGLNYIAKVSLKDPSYYDYTT
mmetsp:Transcript_74777/g.112712  ORF Transcript_74777/g.112712 Transcript_74777/m.112712 type:complete len:92 (-) Transcript_74777:265-540(-)